MRRTFSQKKSGLTIIEMLVYIAVWMTVSSFIFSIYYKCTYATRKANKYIEILRKVRQTSVVMEKDIRSASAILPSFEDFISDEETLILQIPVLGEDEADYQVIYRFSQEGKKSLERIIIDDPMKRRVSHLLAKSGLQKVRFSTDQTKVRPLVEVDLILKQGALKKGRQTIFSFSASLRNTREEAE